MQNKERSVLTVAFACLLTVDVYWANRDLHKINKLFGRHLYNLGVGLAIFLV